MKIPQMIAAELRRLTATRMSLIALIALVAVPILYGGLYLWANQDPYARLDQVPVALVVADEGAITDDGTEVVHAREIADDILDDGAFDWHEVSAAEAEQGLADQEFDFVVAFPVDFSAALESASTDAPRQADVALITNDANSYLATTIGEQAVARIQQQIVEEVNRSAATRFLDGLVEIRTNLLDAAEGAHELADAAMQALGGSGELGSGASALADGTATLADGAGDLAAGAATAADGAQRVADGNAQLAASADRVGAASSTAIAALPDARDDIAQLLADRGTDQATIDAVLAALDPLGDDLRAGDARVQEVVGQIDALAAGSAAVASGTAELAAGSSALADGAGAAADGAAELRDGIGTLTDGLGQLADGAGTLASGLDDGVAAIPDTDADTRVAQADAIADPIALDTEAVTAAGTYGAGLAPFFAALAGWIGIYALFLIVKPISRRAVTALHSPIRVTLAGWLTPALLGAVQMTALYGVLAVALGFTIANPWLTIGVMLLGSATFTAIILALNVWLGSVGQFLGLVLMVLQLVTAGGTFPWQTLPEPLAALHHVLPMGFVVDALRQAMYGGSLDALAGDVGTLLLWLVGALVLAASGVTRMTHFRTLRDLQPSLIG
ncbi:YhgE/Pip family protein [Agromyces sp. SYSU T00194]|uniref:YhgE/Pip family protein n=1 Tax=Agromyces chitinivorans TaxID=3158560 RepID=UPI003399C0E8